MEEVVSRQFTITGLIGYLLIWLFAYLLVCLFGYMASQRQKNKEQKTNNNNRSPEGASSAKPNNQISK